MWVKIMYYDGTELLSKKDINGNRPEIYMCTTNRTGGKTTYFGRMCVNKFLKNQGKFCLEYRYGYELDECADKFFKDLSTLFFDGAIMEGKTRSRGLYTELFFEGKSCGYAVALNSADTIKRFSHLFSDVERIFFDEFQSETNKYCPNEVTKFISIHQSIARGQSKQSRYVPVYMCSNPVSILNPYYVEMGISNRLKDETRFLRGDGFVLEQGFVQSASDAMMESGFNKAFGLNKYIAYATQNVYLNDNDAFIENPPKNGRYIVTLRYLNNEYAVREYANDGIIYCDDRPDKSFKNRIAVTLNDHNINYVMLKKNDIFLSTLRYYFDKGCFRFKDIRCKEAVLKALSY